MQNQILRLFEWTDLGNARALYKLFGHDLKYCTDSETWFRWNSCVWEYVDPGEVRQLIVKTTERLKEAWRDPEAGEKARAGALKFYTGCENRSRMHSALSVAGDLPEIRMKYGEFDRDIWKLGCKNGEIDLRTQKFTPPNKSSLMSKSSGIHYRPEAKCPRWEKFLGEIFCGDTTVIETVQRILGYTLTGSTEEQVMFMLIGGGANGKSTMMNVIRRIMGDYAKLTPFSTFNAASRSEQSNDLAALSGARFVVISESDEDAFLAEAKLKAATGGDLITCRFLNKEFFSYQPQYKIFLPANQLPGMRGMNHGNFRRQVILPFKATFDGAARIATLEDDLVAEGAGILNWMLEGLRKWQFSKLTVDLPKVLLDARQAYKDDMDLVGKWFAERVEVTDSKIMSRSMDLFADYKRYAESLNHRAKAHKTWSGEMKTKGYEAERKEVGMCYSGLALKPEFNGFFEYKWPIGSKIVDNGVKAQIIKEVQV